MKVIEVLLVDDNPADTDLTREALSRNGRPSHIHAVFNGLDAIAFLRREGKYQQAIQVVRGLKSEYPHDFLFCLEEANLNKDAGAGMDAVNAYREVIADGAKPGYFVAAKMELAEFGLGEALRGQRHYAEAAQAYEDAANAAGVGLELKIRSLVAAGECRDLVGARAAAVEDYQQAINDGPTTSYADAARKYLRNPYVGK